MSESTEGESAFFPSTVELGEVGKEHDDGNTRPTAACGDNVVEEGSVVGTVLHSSSTEKGNDGKLVEEESAMQQRHEVMQTNRQEPIASSSSISQSTEGLPVESSRKDEPDSSSHDEADKSAQVVWPGVEGRAPENVHSSSSSSPSSTLEKNGCHTSASAATLPGWTVPLNHTFKYGANTNQDVCHDN
jgi:hypothetical protein